MISNNIQTRCQWFWLATNAIWRMNEWYRRSKGWCYRGNGAIDRFTRHRRDTRSTWTRFSLTLSDKSTSSCLDETRRTRRSSVRYCNLIETKRTQTRYPQLLLRFSLYRYRFSFSFAFFLFYLFVECDDWIALHNITPTLSSYSLSFPSPARSFSLLSPLFNLFNNISNRSVQSRYTSSNVPSMVKCCSLTIHE